MSRTRKTIEPTPREAAENAFRYSQEGLDEAIERLQNAAVAYADRARNDLDSAIEGDDNASSRLILAGAELKEAAAKYSAAVVWRAHAASRARRAGVQLLALGSAL